MISTPLVCTYKAYPSPVCKAGRQKLNSTAPTASRLRKPGETELHGTPTTTAAAGVKEYAVCYDTTASSAAQRPPLIVEPALSIMDTLEPTQLLLTCSSESTLAGA